MDKTEARDIQKAVDDAIAPILAAHNLRRISSRAGYDAGSIRLTLAFQSTDPALDPVVNDWARYAAGYGLPVDGIGATFNSRGTLYRVVGLDMNRRTYPVVAQAVNGGKKMLFKADGVARLLGVKS